MSELIRRETVLEALGTFSDKKHANCHFWYGIQSAVEIIESAPAVDAVEVVRCEDCKHIHVINTDQIYALCDKTNFIFQPFGIDIRKFGCTSGERRESEDGEKHE